MRSWLGVVVGLACVAQSAAQAPQVQTGDSATANGTREGDGIEFSTNPNGSFHFPFVLFTPNDANNPTDFDQGDYFQAIGLQPNRFLIQDSKNQHTEIDYLDAGGGRSNFSACLSLGHGWVYAKRVTLTQPASSDSQSATDEDEQALGDLFLGPHWPIVIVRDIGAGAEGTEMLVVRRDHKSDADTELVYVIMMAGEPKSYVWAHDENDANATRRVITFRDMEDAYLRITITENAGQFDYDIEPRFFKNGSADDYDDEALQIRQTVLDLRTKNQDKFWNPGEESY